MKLRNVYAPGGLSMGFKRRRISALYPIPYGDLRVNGGLTYGANLEPISPPAAIKQGQISSSIPPPDPQSPYKRR